ncbi:hypothetical protein HPB48_001026 [Haemaphysalis longicornis]|uniref:Uncharacterized protein n=1 Tax=Haemaphysalis longicornis TaxID=44386 RepID=A0A9J6FXV3_HAELO|nr:hypothetical protein HPB48_001026 [Haemaphysalis longicornis]
MDYTIGFSMDARRGPAATQSTAIFKSDEPEEDGGVASTLPGRINDADSAAGPSGRKWGSESSQRSFGGTDGVRRSCYLCSYEGDHAGKPLYQAPCARAKLFVHRSCMQNRRNCNRGNASRRSCKALYPAQRSPKPIWKWFWEEE